MSTGTDWRSELNPMAPSYGFSISTDPTPKSEPKGGNRHGYGERYGCGDGDSESSEDDVDSPIITRDSWDNPAPHTPVDEDSVSGEESEPEPETKGKGGPSEGNMRKRRWRAKPAQQKRRPEKHAAYQQKLKKQVLAVAALQEKAQQKAKSCLLYLQPPQHQVQPQCQS